ncbi:hypothetical protein ACOMHN_048773 [Nucella lapillus]
MSLPICKFFRSEQGCKFGNKCRYKHADPPPFPACNQSGYQGQHNGSVGEISFCGNFLSPPILSDNFWRIWIISEKPRIYCCCFGSRCRFEHTQPGNGRPSRFQPARGGPRHEKDRPHRSSGSLDNNGEGGKELSYPRHPDGDLPHKPDPSRTGSAAASLDSAKARALNQRKGNQPANSVPAEEGSEGRSDGRSGAVPNIRSDKVCQFFMRGWCWKGRRCQFLHPRQQAAAVKKGKSDPEAEHEHQKEKVAPGIEEQKEPEPAESSASAQNRSADKKPSPKPSKVQNTRPTYAAQGTKKYRRDEVDDVEGSRLRRTEIDQLMKRFPKNKVKVNRDCAENFQCVINFSPTDPDWPFDVRVFQLQVDIPPDYPFEMLSLSVPEEQVLPETVRRYLEISIEEWVKEKERQLDDNSQVELVFRPFLRWLDRNIEDVVTEGLKQLKRELVAKASGLEFISAKELQKQYPGQGGPSNGGGDEDHSDSDDDETESESQDKDTSSDYDEDSDEDGVGDETAEADRSAEKKGTEVTLKNLQLRDSAATLYFEKVSLLIHCERCKGISEFMASPGRVSVIQCGQCSQTQTATYRPAMAHHFSSVVGYLDLDGCLPFDVILQNCSAVMACMNCSKDTKSGAVIAGQPQDHWCRVCHHKLRVATDGVRFTQLEPSNTPQSLRGLVKVVVPTRKRIPKDPAIQEGRPLPNFGTCRHYKKSYRWLRFPCCGKCYPCDVCHDSQEDHEMTLANRMVCGFCCKEQPYAADRPCKGCNMNMTRVHTKHWEGGQGCRDKISMARNDKQKYRNESKTISKHSQKVKDMQSKKRTKLRHM